MQLIDQNHEGGDNADAKLEEFLASKFLKTTTLPLGILGSGNADLGAKYECLFHCLKLDVGAVSGLQSGFGQLASPSPLVN